MTDRNGMDRARQPGAPYRPQRAAPTVERNFGCSSMNQHEPCMSQHE